MAHLSCFLRVPPVSPSATSKAIGWQQHRSHLLPQIKLEGRGMAALACNSHSCESVAKAQPGLPPQAGSSLTADLFPTGSGEDA